MMIKMHTWKPKMETHIPLLKSNWSSELFSIKIIFSIKLNRTEGWKKHREIANKKKLTATTKKTVKGEKQQGDL